MHGSNTVTLLAILAHQYDMRYLNLTPSRSSDQSRVYGKPVAFRTSFRKISCNQRGFDVHEPTFPAACKASCASPAQYVNRNFSCKLNCSGMLC